MTHPAPPDPETAGAAPRADAPGTPDAEAARIPRPPTPAEIDLISGEQGKIADEWAPAGAPGMPRPNTDDASGRPVPDVPDA